MLVVHVESTFSRGTAQLYSATLSSNLGKQIGQDLRIGPSQQAILICSSSPSSSLAFLDLVRQMFGM